MTFPIDEFRRLVKDAGSPRWGVAPLGTFIRDHAADIEAMAAAQALHQELLYAVEYKYPNETRHQTALRYIRQAETVTDDRACAAQAGEPRSCNHDWEVISAADQHYVCRLCGIRMPNAHEARPQT